MFLYIGFSTIHHCCHPLGFWKCLLQIREETTICRNSVDGAASVGVMQWARREEGRAPAFFYWLSPSLAFLCHPPTPNPQVGQYCIYQYNLAQIHNALVPFSSCCDFWRGLLMVAAWQCNSNKTRIYIVFCFILLLIDLYPVVLYKY